LNPQRNTRTSHVGIQRQQREKQHTKQITKPNSSQLRLTQRREGQAAGYDKTTKATTTTRAREKKSGRAAAAAAAAAEEEEQQTKQTTTKEQKQQSARKTKLPHIRSSV
jgi:hypothetical protein